MATKAQLQVEVHRLNAVVERLNKELYSYRKDESEKEVRRVLTEYVSNCEIPIKQALALTSAHMKNFESFDDDDLLKIHVTLDNVSSKSVYLIGKNILFDTVDKHLDELELADEILNNLNKADTVEEAILNLTTHSFRLNGYMEEFTEVSENVFL